MNPALVEWDVYELEAELARAGYDAHPATTKTNTRSLHPWRIDRLLRVYAQAFLSRKKIA